MLRTTANRIAAPLACFGIGTLFTLGCVIAADADDLAGPTIVPSSGQTITEDDPRWDCETMGNRTCGPRSDGSVYSAGAFTGQGRLRPCAGEDVEPHLPCRVLMRPTYVVGGDGVRHEVCAITLVNAEDSQMVCADDTVWAS